MTLGWRSPVNRRIRTHVEALERRYVFDAWADAAQASLGLPPLESIPAGYFVQVPNTAPQSVGDRWRVDPVGTPRMQVNDTTISGLIATFYGQVPQHDRLYVCFRSGGAYSPLEDFNGSFMAGATFVPAKLRDVPGPTFQVWIDPVTFPSDTTNLSSFVFFQSNSGDSYMPCVGTTYFTSSRFAFAPYSLSQDPQYAEAGDWTEVRVPSILNAMPEAESSRDLVGRIQFEYGDGSPIVRTKWDMSDPSYPVINTYSAPSHRYEKPGTYVAKVTITMPPEWGGGTLGFTRAVQVTEPSRDEYAPPPPLATPTPAPASWLHVSGYALTTFGSPGETVNSLGSLGIRTNVDGPIAATVTWVDGSIDRARLVATSNEPLGRFDSRSYALELLDPRRFDAGQHFGEVTLQLPSDVQVSSDVSKLTANLTIDDGSLRFWNSSTAPPVCVTGVGSTSAYDRCAQFIDSDAPADAVYNAWVETEDGRRFPASVNQWDGYRPRQVVASPLFWVRPDQYDYSYESRTVTVVVERAGAGRITQKAEFVVMPSMGPQWIAPLDISTIALFAKFESMQGYGFALGNRVTRLPDTFAWSGPDFVSDVTVEVRWADGVTTPATLTPRSDGRYDVVTDRTFAKPDVHRYAVVADLGGRELAVGGEGSIAVQGNTRQNLVPMAMQDSPATPAANVDYGMVGAFFAVAKFVDFDPGSTAPFELSVAFANGSPARIELSDDGPGPYYVGIQPYLLDVGLNDYHIVIKRGEDILEIDGSLTAVSRVEGGFPADPALDEGADWPVSGPCWIYVPGEPLLATDPMESLEDPAPGKVDVDPSTSNQDEPPALPHGDPPNVLDARAVPVAVPVTPLSVTVRATWFSLFGDAVIGALPGDANVTSDDWLSGL